MHFPHFIVYDITSLHEKIRNVNFSKINGSLQFTLENLVLTIYENFIAVQSRHSPSTYFPKVLKNTEDFYILHIPSGVRVITDFVLVGSLLASKHNKKSCKGKYQTD